MPRPRNKRAERTNQIEPPEPAIRKPKNTRPHVIINAKRTNVYKTLQPELDAYFRAGVPVEFHTRPFYDLENTTGHFPVYTSPREIREFLNNLTNNARGLSHGHSKILIRKGKTRSGGRAYYTDTRRGVDTYPRNGRKSDSRLLVPNASREHNSHIINGQPYYNERYDFDALQYMAGGAENTRPAIRNVEPIVRLAVPRSQGGFGYNT